MESDQIPEDLAPQNVLDMESQSLYELVLHRFESTLYSFDDGFPAAFDSLSEDILNLLNKLREFVINCFQRIKRSSKLPKSTKFILNVEDSLATALGVKAGKWQLKDKTTETEDHCGMEKILMRDQSGAGSSHECEVCGVEFADKKSLDAHGRVCIGEDEDQTNSEPKSKSILLHPCPKCGKEFSSKRWSAHHSARCDGVRVRAPIWRRGGQGGLEYVCAVEGCSSNGAAFSKMYGLRAHFYAEHVNEEEKIFSCDHCPCRFASRAARNDHVRLRHLRPHECLECGRRFGERDKLRNHSLTHTGEKPFACEHCPYRTAKQYNLDVHKRSRHGDDGGRDSNVCEQCGLGFRNAATLKGHITTVHSKLKADDMQTAKLRLDVGKRRRKVAKARKVRPSPRAKSKQALPPPTPLQPEQALSYEGRQPEIPVEQQPLVPFAVAMEHGELPHIQIPPQHHHQMTVAEANEFFLDFEQQQPQQEPVANVLPQSMLPIVAGDEQLAQETVAQILSQATTTAATHIMLPLPPPPPPSQDHLVFESHPLLPHLDEHQQLIVHQHQELQRYPMEQGESVHQPLPQNPP